jgi:hypothetical protein
LVGSPGAQADRPTARRERLPSGSLPVLEWHTKPHSTQSVSAQSIATSTTVPESNCTPLKDASFHDSRPLRGATGSQSAAQKYQRPLGAERKWQLCKTVSYGRCAFQSN